MNEIQLIPVENRSHYKEYLLLADESELIIDEYINTGELYAISVLKTTIGACLFTFPDQQTVEIKNVAIIPSYRRRGYGKQMIHKAFLMFKKRKFRRMIVGTSNSSIENIAFYQKAGFRFHSIKKDYFLHYPEPFYENGIQGLDMIVFQKNLVDL